MLYILAIWQTVRQTQHCSGNGTCILDTGECQCYPRYSGNDCGSCGNNLYGPNCSVCMYIVHVLLFLKILQIVTLQPLALEMVYVVIVKRVHLMEPLSLIAIIVLKIILDKIALFVCILNWEFL